MASYLGVYLVAVVGRAWRPSWESLRAYCRARARPTTLLWVLAAAIFAAMVGPTLDDPLVDVAAGRFEAEVAPQQPVLPSAQSPKSPKVRPKSDTPNGHACLHGRRPELVLADAAPSSAAPFGRARRARARPSACSARGPPATA